MPASRHVPLWLFSIASLTFITACATPQTADPSDPLEPMNRGVHAFNKTIDKVAARPAAKVWSYVVPQPLRQGVSNMADNMDLPGVVINQLLQARIGEAGANTLRFSLNATAGLLGLFDVASVMGMEKTDADFGQTLAVWGMGEGPYVELPIEGPSNMRDGIGFFVDLAMDPFDLPKREANGALILKGISRLNDRARYNDSVDSLLYESADSYAQLRLLYQQNRRFEIGQVIGETSADGGDDFIDPYGDETFIDPYAE